MNLTAENQIGPAINHERVTAVLLYEFWGVCAKRHTEARQKRAGQRRPNLERCESTGEREFA